MMLKKECDDLLVIAIDQARAVINNNSWLSCGLSLASYGYDAKLAC